MKRILLILGFLLCLALPADSALTVFNADVAGVSSGTTAQRPPSPIPGQQYYNTTLSWLEWWDAAGSTWKTNANAKHSDIITQTWLTALSFFKKLQRPQSELVTRFSRFKCSHTYERIYIDAQY